MLLSYLKLVFFTGPFHLVGDVWCECIFIRGGARR